MMLHASQMPIILSRKDARLSKQMEVTEDSEIVFHTLPGGRKRNPRNPHNLMAAIQAGRGAEKKH